MSSPSTRDPWSVVVALVTVQLLFGAHYVVAKIIVSRLDPAAWACLRSASAFVVLAVLALLFRRRLPDWRGIRWLALCSVFGVILNQALFLEGLARMPLKTRRSSTRRSRASRCWARWRWARSG